MKDSEKFSIRCTICDRTYMELNIALKPGEMYEADLGGIVPCHAESLNIQRGPEDPWTRVLRLLSPKKKKEEPKSKYALQVHGFDSMISTVRIARME